MHGPHGQRLQFAFQPEDAPAAHRELADVPKSLAPSGDRSVQAETQPRNRIRGAQLEYNPYAAPYAELIQRISSAENDRNRRRQQIEWYDGFDVDAAFSSMQRAIRERDAFYTTLRDIDARLERQKSRAATLRKETGFSINPRDWFSSDRSAKKSELEAIHKDVAQLLQRQNDLHKQVQDATALIDRHQDDMKRHRTSNRQEDEAVVKARSIEIDQLKNQLGEIRQQKERVDEQLAKPRGDHREFKQRKGLLEAEIRRAEAFEQQLSKAANGYERKQIHDSCGAVFGESKPARVLVNRRRELESVNRNIDKLEGRLRTISMRATHVIKTLVIDGSNLCHQHEKFIGLAALRALTASLSSEYSVIIVFDPTIRGLLRMDRRDIAKQFENAVVHVVSPPHAADETVLDAAEDASAYVISNDRFQDYRDKPAVRDQRILRHEILDNRIFVHDLSVAERFETA